MVLNEYLVIVESPSKCKTIEGYLGDKYRVIATCGHFRSLNELSQITIGDDIKIKYSIIEIDDNFDESLGSIIRFYNIIGDNLKSIFQIIHT